MVRRKIISLLEQKALEQLFQGSDQAHGTKPAAKLLNSTQLYYTDQGRRGCNYSGKTPVRRRQGEDRVEKESQEFAASGMVLKCRENCVSGAWFSPFPHNIRFSVPPSGQGPWSLINNLRK